MYFTSVHETGQSDSKGKGRVHPRTGHEGPEEEHRNSSTLSLTSALDRGGWSTPRPGHFTPRKQTRYPLYRRLGGPQGQSGQVITFTFTSFYNVQRWTKSVQLTILCTIYHPQHLAQQCSHPFNWTKRK